MPRPARSARFAVDGVLAAVGAVLLELDPVRVVAPVLLGDVVAVLAVRARHGDLWTNVGRLSHGGQPSLRYGSKRSAYQRKQAPPWHAKRATAGQAPSESEWRPSPHHAMSENIHATVAVAGLEPATQRL